MLRIRRLKSNSRRIVMASVPVRRESIESIADSSEDDSIDFKRVASVVLGGGQGTRLFPLTKSRCKPAICFGGRYRLIDVPVSNAINSGCNKIFIITQFLSTSLNRYISQTYNMDSFSSGFIDVLAVEEKPNQEGWFRGTADAVRKNLEHFIETPADYFLILSGDQLYNMDFNKILKTAKSTDADVVVATLPIKSSDAHRMGIMQVNEKQFVTEFYEKPKDLSHIKVLKNPYTLAHPGEDYYLGSMGIYIFKREALFEILNTYEGDDFGKDIIPALVKEGRVAAYMHQGYWEDIGTIESFYQANMDLAKSKAPFNCYDELHPIYTTRYNLPGPKISDTVIHDSIICEGSIIQAKEISNSIVGPRSDIKRGTVIRDSYIMGNDFYEAPMKDTSIVPNHLNIGENCFIQRAILDKNICLGDNVQLINKNNYLEYDGDGVYIRDGIIIVTRGAYLPNNFVL